MTDTKTISKQQEIEQKQMAENYRDKYKQWSRNDWRQQAYEKQKAHWEERQKRMHASWEAYWEHQRKRFKRRRVLCFLLWELREKAAELREGEWRRQGVIANGALHCFRNPADPTVLGGNFKNVDGIFSSLALSEVLLDHFPEVLHKDEDADCLDELLDCRGFFGAAAVDASTSAAAIAAASERVDVASIFGSTASPKNKVSSPKQSPKSRSRAAIPGALDSVACLTDTQARALVASRKNSVLLAAPAGAGKLTAACLSAGLYAAAFARKMQGPGKKQFKRPFGRVVFLCPDMAYCDDVCRTLDALFLPKAGVSYVKYVPLP